MTTKIVPVILAGGQGTRLWPMSRAARPKQFLPLTGPTSLYQETLRRVSDPEVYEPAVIITNAEYRFLVAEQAQEMDVPLSAVLLEPVAPVTAAIAAAAFHAEKLFDRMRCCTLASDHAVTVDDNYRQSIEIASAAARAGRLVTFGITPTGPETGYGYVEAGAETSRGLHDVRRFVEKPDRANAEKMLAAGGYYWNSGTFMLGAGTFLAECASLSPESHAAAKGAVDKARTDLDFVRLDETAFAAAPNISVDYAIFEKSARVSIVPVTYAWSDLGSWDAVWKASPKDAEGNVTNGGRRSAKRATRS